MSLNPLSILYANLLRVRNFAFDQKWIESKKVSVPVISVGNITTGGTGKTPFIHWLIQFLKEKGHRPGVVSRGYGGSYKGVVKVSAEGDWTLFGDEPFMLFQNNKDIPIYLGKKRLEAAQNLLDREQVDILLADDAFQHRYLKRDLDCVLLDLTQALKDYECLPQGRGREPLEGLQRAQWVIFTKGNLLSESDRAARKEELLKWIPSNVKTLTADLVTTGIFDAGGNRMSGEGNAPLILLSGIGRPKSFELSIEKHCKQRVSRHFIFRDHHPYSIEELGQVFKELPPEQRIVTTEKDFIRLREFESYSSRFLVSRVGFEVHGDLKGFYEDMDRFFK